MQCPECHNEVSDKALYCGSCGKPLRTSTRCEKCRHERNKDPFCENCGLRHVPEYEDNSFLEMTAKRILSSMREVCFTHFFMGISDRWLGLKRKAGPVRNCHTLSGYS